MRKTLPDIRPGVVDGGVLAPASSAPAAEGHRFRLAQRARELVRDEARRFQLATAVIVTGIADDAFLHPEPGTSAGDHLASGLIPIAIAMIAALAYPRLRPRLRGCIALLFGALAIEAGIVDGLRHVVINTTSGDDVTAIVAALAGAALVALGAITLWRARRLDERLPRRYARRGLQTAAAALVMVFVVVPTGMAILATHVARAPVPAARLGAGYHSVTFTTGDGLRLAGWYVPSKNGAAVVVSPGRSPATQAHARMLIHHGYGVLVFDRRGEGQSQGDRNMYGWSGEKDLVAAVAFLQRQADVHHGRIGGLGLSVGGEMLLQTAAETTGLKAVVSEGAGTRSLREHLHIPALGTVQRWFTPWIVETAALSVMSNSSPPPYLGDLVARIAPRPILLIRALHGLDDESLNRVYYADARQPKTLWEVTQGGHTGALQAIPKQYENGVSAFFDQALLAH